MSRDFAQIAVTEAVGLMGTTAQFDGDAAAACIRSVLATATQPDAADLPRRLENAAHAFVGDVNRERAWEALKTMAEGFEVFLRLLAAIKFGGRDELLDGNEYHIGFARSSLGALLRGQPELKRGQPEIVRDRIERERIVRYEENGRSPASRAYEVTRLQRNEVHRANPAPAPVTILKAAQSVFAAYVFACQENLEHLTRQLDPHRAYLLQVVDKCRSAYPFVVEQWVAPLPGGPRGRTHVLGDVTSAPLATLVDRLLTQKGSGIAILGDPGVGKTTLLNDVACRLAEARLERPLGGVPVPILVEARRFTPTTDFCTLFGYELGGQENFEELAESGDGMLLVDGANEVQSALLPAALTDLRNLRNRFSRCSLFVTSRFRRLLGDLDLDTNEIVPLSEAQVEDYLVRFFSNGAHAGAFLEELRRAPRLLELCRNPLLLKMLVDISGDDLHFPANRGRLLHEFMRRFLVREHDRFRPLEPLTIEILLARIAYDARRRGSVVVATERAQQIVATELATLQHGVGVVDVMSAVQDALILRDAGGGGLVFFHELIQEYYSALELKARAQNNPAELSQLEADPWWQEVLILFTGLEDEPGSLIKQFAKDALPLSARCVMDAVRPDAALQREVVRRAEADRSPAALDALSVIWTQDAREALVRTLGRKREVEDFLLNFKTEVLPAGLDLLGTAPSEDLLVAVLHAFSRQGHPHLSGELRLRIGLQFLDLVQQRTWILSSGPSSKKLAKLLEFADLPTSAIPHAVDLTQRLILEGEVALAQGMAQSFSLSGQDPHLDYALAVAVIDNAIIRGGRAGETVTEVVPASRLPEDLIQDVLARLLLAHAWEAAAAVASTLPSRPSWVVPLLPAAAGDLLRRSNAESLMRFLSSFVDEEAGLAIMHGLLNGLRVPFSQLEAVRQLLRIESEAFGKVLSDYTELALARGDVDAAARLADRLQETTFWPRIAKLALQRGRHVVAASIVIAHGLDSEFPEVVAMARESLNSWTDDLEKRWSDVIFGPLWARLSDEERETAIARVPLNASEMLSLDSWDQSARRRLGSRVLESLRTGGAVKPAVAEVLAIRSEAQALVLRQVEAAAAETPEKALTLAAEWGIDSPSVRACLPKSEIIASGEASADEVNVALLAGIINEEQAIGWFSARLVRGDADSALKIMGLPIRSRLAEPATLAVKQLLEIKPVPPISAVAAGQMIVALELMADFIPELPEVIPHVFDAGKPGCAKHLCDALGPRFATESGNLWVGAVARAIDGEEFSRLITLTTDCPSFLQPRVTELLDGALARLISAEQFEKAIELLGFNQAAIDLVPREHVHVLRKEAIARGLRVKARLGRRTRDGYVAVLAAGVGESFLDFGMAPTQASQGFLLDVWLSPRSSSKRIRIMNCALPDQVGLSRTEPLSQKEAPREPTPREPTPREPTPREAASQAAPLKPGDVLRGRVTKLTEYGAFINLDRGGAGLVHKSQLHHNPQSSHATVLRSGLEIEVKVLRVEHKDGKLRVSLSADGIWPPEQPGGNHDASGGKGFRLGEIARFKGKGKPPA
jgi:predicted RNA-binding protein with RPS1 domain